MGHCGDRCFYLALPGAWQDKPITVTEPLALAIYVLHFSHLAGCEHLVRSDSTVALAVLFNTAEADDAKYMASRVSDRSRASPSSPPSCGANTLPARATPPILEAAPSGQKSRHFSQRSGVRHVGNRWTMLSSPFARTFYITPSPARLSAPDATS